MSASRFPSDVYARRLKAAAAAADQAGVEGLVVTPGRHVVSGLATMDRRGIDGAVEGGSSAVGGKN